MAENNNKRPPECPPELEDFYSAGRDIMRRSNKKFGAIATEERRFRELFGCGAPIALTLWRMLVEEETIPEGGTIQHFLWALMFLKVYGKEAQLCSLAGGIDPKTLRKWVWSFITPIADLEEKLVS